MRFLLLLTAYFFAGLLFLPAQECRLDSDGVERILREQAEKMEGEGGAWLLYYRERIVFVLCDAEHNRLRIFTPITESKYVTPQEMEKMLEANFQSALDAKYGIYEDFVASVFTHPLAELTAGQLTDALQQVVTLADNFRQTYSSSDLLFGGETGGQEEEQKRINESPSGKKRS